MVKVILNGCSGKMGSVISNLAETKFPNVEIVAGIDNNTKAQRPYPILQNQKIAMFPMMYY